MTKALVFGSSGMLGRDLCKILQDRRISYVGTYDRSFVSNSVHFSFTKRPTIHNELVDLLKTYKPTVCFNCVVQRFVDVCENDWELTKFVNVDVVRIIASACSELNIHFVQISTDYVFDGANPPYYPMSLAHPLQNYGISKLLAEFETRVYATSYTIVRVPVLYTNNYKSLDESAVTVLAKKVLNRIDTHKEDAVSIRRPVFIPDLCMLLLDIAQHPDTYSNTNVHFYNSKDVTTKYDMVRAMGSYLGKSIDHVIPQYEFSDAAPRPHDTQLADTSYCRAAFPDTSIADGIDLCLKHLKHPNLSTASPDDVCVLMDLDGTIVDTERLHFDAYLQAYRELLPNSSCFDFDQFLLETHTGNWKSYLKSLIHDHDLFEHVCKRKKEILLSSVPNIRFMPGMEQLLQIILERNLPYAVVTNTCRDTVSWMQTRLPLLQKLQNWVTKNDYSVGKPDPSCYQIALERYSHHAQHIVGFENTVNGYQSLRGVANVVYIITSHDSPSCQVLKKEDVYLIKEYTIDI